MYKIKYYINCNKRTKVKMNINWITAHLKAGGLKNAKSTLLEPFSVSVLSLGSSHM